MTTVEDGWIVASGWRHLGAATILCEHPRCKRARDDPSSLPPFPHAAALVTAAEVTQDVENDLVAALPLEVRGSAAAHARWLAQLRQLVSVSSLAGKAGSGEASPLGPDLAGVVCGYLDALAAETPVWVVAPAPLCAVAALSPRLTLGEALAVLVDAFHTRKCRNEWSARADLASRLSDVTLETVKGWELTDDRDVELAASPSPFPLRGATDDEVKAGPRLPSMVSLLQRPLGLFLRQPVRLEFDTRGRFGINKFMDRDVLLTAACTLAGIGLHECPSSTPYLNGLESPRIGLLHPSAPPTRIPVLPNALAAPTVSTAPMASAELRWTDRQDYVWRVVETALLRPLSIAPAAPLRCPSPMSPWRTAPWRR